jgi:hypothetical protein
MRAPRRDGRNPAAGRRFDQLTFKIQEAIAPPLYPDAHVHDGERPRPSDGPAIGAVGGKQSCAAVVIV